MRSTRRRRLVIVPAMSRDDDPAVLEWLRSQAAKGAMIVGVCAGAKVVAEAGLLDGKTGDDALVFRRGAARQASRDPLCRGPPAGGRPGRCHDDGNHRVHADGAHLDRGHRRPREGAGRRPGHRPDALGRASRQRRVPLHAPVRADGHRQHGRLLEPRAARHRARRPASTKCRSPWSRTPGRGPTGHAR